MGNSIMGKDSKPKTAKGAGKGDKGGDKAGAKGGDKGAKGGKGADKAEKGGGCSQINVRHILCEKKSKWVKSLTKWQWSSVKTRPRREGLSAGKSEEPWLVHFKMLPLTYQFHLWQSQSTLIHP